MFNIQCPNFIFLTIIKNCCSNLSSPFGGQEAFNVQFFLLLPVAFYFLLIPTTQCLQPWQYSTNASYLTGEFQCIHHKDEWLFAQLLLLHFQKQQRPFHFAGNSPNAAYNFLQLAPQHTLYIF